MGIEGRIKDVIIRGGNKISAPEVEAHLTAHPNIEQAAVVAMPDAVLGERICAYIVAAGDVPTLLELKKLLRGRGVAEHKLPDRIVKVATFPLTGLGKVDKKALARDIADRLAAVGQA
jgi:2,3-dihydroxybenzoate-AMP ligase/pristinamycin I synthetase-1